MRGPRLVLAGILFLAEAWLAGVVAIGAGYPAGTLPAGMGNRNLETLETRALGPAPAVAPPARLVRGFRFAFLGDVNNEGWEMAGPLLRRAQEEGADFVVIGGDMVRTASRGEFRFAFGQLERAGLHIPVLFVPGNHDTKADPSLFPELVGPLRYSFTVGPALFIVLNNGLQHPTSKDWTWAEDLIVRHQAEIEESGFRPFVFLFMHCPPFNWPGQLPRDVQTESAYEPLKALMERRRIDVIGTGHAHDYHHEVRGTTRYVVAGGLPERVRGEPVRALVFFDVEPSEIRHRLAEMPYTPDAWLQVQWRVVGWAHPLVTGLWFVFGPAALAGFWAIGRLCRRPRPASPAVPAAGGDASV